MTFHSKPGAIPGACGCTACAAPVGMPRRGFLGVGAMALAAGAGLAFAPRTALAQSTLSPDEALALLAAGNDRFVSAKFASFQEDLDILKQNNVAKQEPFAAVLSCADSRVPVELVFDQSIGHVFVTRVAGNVATSEVIASLEYGQAVLGVKAIMVLAHEGCGAVKAAVGGKAVPGQIGGLYPPLRAAVLQAGPDYEAVAKANARIQADILINASPLLGEAIKQGSLKIVAAYYALATGKVTPLA